uniref:Uncharacterized protein n=1 Tax=Setaria italica TaxID=4555 RepID=K3Z160_SETIT
MQYELSIWKAASVICNNGVFFLLGLDSVIEHLCLIEDTLFHWFRSFWIMLSLFVLEHCTKSGQGSRMKVPMKPLHCRK